MRGLPTKTKFILFRAKNKKTKHDLKFQINNNFIKQVKNTTFLGIVVDEFLKNNQMCSNYIKNSTFYKPEFLKVNLLCIGLSISYIYGNLIWGNAYKSRIQKIVNIQKKLLD